MGTDENSIIQIKEQLTKQAGDKINVPLIRKLTGAGVTGTTTLEGNEESLLNYNHQLTVELIRHAVRFHVMEEQRTEIGLREAGRAGLKRWMLEKMRSGIIDALYSPNVDGKTPYASTSETDKDTWLAANADRVQFGAALSNNAANDHSTCLAEIDNTSDKLTPAIVSMAKRRAKLASPAIRPIMVDEHGETYIMLCHSYPFRDLKLNSTIINAHQYAASRGRDNPLFQDGDLYWDGVIIKEVPEIDVLTDVGNGGTVEVAANFLLGAQAVGIGWAQRSKTVAKEFDYDVEYGVSISEIRGIEKFTFNNIQHGVYTAYTAAMADT